MQNKVYFNGLYNLIYDSGYTLNSLSIQTGISRTTLSRRFIDGNHFTFGEAFAIKKLLKMTDEQVVDLFFYGR